MKASDSEKNEVKALRYTQKDGFTVIDHVAKTLEWPEGWEEADTTKMLNELGWRIGYPERYGREFGVEVVIYASQAKGRAVVELTLGDYVELIVPDTLADLMALRLALAPLVQLGLQELGDSYNNIAVRAFIHKYKHDPVHPCKECESSDEREQRKTLEKRRIDGK